MKKLFVVLLHMFFSSFCFSQDNPTKCQFDQTQLCPETVPNYLQPWWNNTRIGKFAVLFVDFPDGRYINGEDTLQPFYDYQLEWVAENGELDAAGEMGLVLDQTNIHAGNKFVKASKYSWFNRWDMFFDSLGVYYGTAHPDWASNGDSAWGSFKQYWKEASNGKFELIPYTTHPEEQNYKLRTGIINDYVMINGTPIISCLTLPKNKYGTNSSNSYLRSYNSNEDLIAAATAMIADATSLKSSKTSFNLSQFYSEGGTLFIFFAGSHGGLKDIGTITPKVTVIRSRENQITDPESRIDGFGVAAHQYGHIELGWYHTNSGRCDIMNGGDVHDNNCPQLPNPVFRIQQGWLNPTALEYTQQLDSLPPIETTYRCGVVTIYGKPSASPDWSSGEYIIVENRRRLGFDRTIVRKEILEDPEYQDFKGGLLAWHFTPYYQHPDPYFLGLSQVKFVHNDTMTYLAHNTGNPKTFFAWKQNTLSQFYNLDTNKTYSAANLKTGIELKNIQNDNYGNINSTISLRLNYLIAEPPQYSDVIFFRDYNKHYVNYSDTVFFHKSDTAGFFSLAPGCVIETAFNPNTSLYGFRTLEAKGTESMPITFKGAGYGDFVNYTKGITISLPVSFSSIDSLLLSHIEFRNIQYPGAFTPITIVNGSAFTPCVSAMTCIRGIMGSSIVLSNYTGSVLRIADIVLNNIDLKFGFGQVVNYGRSEITDGNIHYNSCSPRFTGSSGLLRLHGNSEIVFESNDLEILIDSNASLSLNGASLYTVYPSQRWKGISLSNSGHDSIINCTFSNAKTGLSFVNDEQHKFTNRIIKNCTFNIPSGGDHKGIYGENNYSILVEGNRFNMPASPGGSPFYTGLYLKNVTPSSPPEAAGEEGATATPYSLNIVNNTFRNGSSGIVLANYTSNLLPYYIKGNRFDSLDAHAATVNIIGMKITGIIKDNVLSSSQSPIGIHLINSSPNLLNNILVARDVSLHLVGSSYANLAPNIYNNQAYWSGGNGKLKMEN
jgi:M6 family metalloprotease-like protein